MSRKVALPSGGTTGQALTKQSNGDYDLYWQTPGAGPGAGGDVVGPASATSGAVVLYDGTTGKLIKNSTILPTTVGIAIANLANPSAVRFIRINADNSVTARTAAEMLSDIGAQASGSYLTSANIVGTITNGVTTNAPSEDAVFDALAAKQDTLVSATNIKTINSSSILGAGNLAVGDMILNTAQTVTAKKLFQHTMLEIGDDDASNRYIVMGGNLSADRLVYFPNLTGNDTWVFLDQSQALTNKSVNGVTLTAAGGGTNYLRDNGTYGAVSASLPDLVITKLAPALDQTVTAGYAGYISDYYEITDTKYLEVGDGSIYEIG